MILEVRGCKPKLGKVFVAPSADIIGEVQIGDESSIWFNTTLRGDVAPIVVGKQTSIQDNCCLHGTYNRFPVTVGDRCTVGHNVTLHGCTVGHSVLVGMGSTLLDGVEVGDYCMIGAGSLLTEGKKFPARSLIFGRPAKVVRELTEDEIKFLDQSANNYMLYKSWYEEVDDKKKGETK